MKLEDKIYNVLSSEKFWKQITDEFCNWALKRSDELFPPSKDDEIPNNKEFRTCWINAAKSAGMQKDQDWSSGLLYLLKEAKGHKDSGLITPESVSDNK